MKHIAVIGPYQDFRCFIRKIGYVDSTNQRTAEVIVDGIRFFHVSSPDQVRGIHLSTYFRVGPYSAWTDDHHFAVEDAHNHCGRR